MPDFVGDKSKPRKMLGVTTRKQGTVNREEHPITALRRVAKDFAAGISALSRLALSNPVTTAPGKNTSLITHYERILQKDDSKHTHSRTDRASARSRDTDRLIDRPGRITERTTTQPGRSTTERTSSILKEITSGFSFKSAMTERLMGRTPVPASVAPTHTISTPSPIRVSSPRLGGQRARSVRTGRASSIAAGADREARHHLDNPATGAAHELPSAARLAQILRADQLMRAGDVKLHPQVQRWAEAIRSGKRREIADLNPERVERILHESMGGKEAAQARLSTPEINQLIDRHHSTLQTIQTGLRESEKVIDRAVGNHAHRRARNGTGVEPTRLSPAVAARDYTGLAAPHTPVGQREDISRLAEMLATNEEPHLYAEDNDRRQMMQQSAQEDAAAPSGASKGVDRPMGASEAKHRPIASGISANAKREVPSAISAPPQRSVQTQVDANEPNKGRKKERMELSGTMTLVSRGQTIGDMRMQAELR